MTQQNYSAMTVLATTLWSMFFVVLIPVSDLHAAVASARIAIVKIASLNIDAMSTDQLNLHGGLSKMTTTACLSAGGESVPYRVRAISLSGAGAFAVKSNQSDERVPYNVVWAAGDISYALENQQDTTEVLHIGTGVSCEHSSLHVQLNPTLYALAPNENYTDTLSLILVIE